MTKFDYRLCFVQYGKAYFTSQDVHKQWGDDWDDAPYEHNAGEPYQGDGVKIEKVAFESYLVTPDFNCSNSQWSVQDINACKIPWLRTEDYTHGTKLRIMAGTRLHEFIREIDSIGGSVYLKA